MEREGESKREQRVPSQARTLAGAATRFQDAAPPPDSGVMPSPGTAPVETLLYPSRSTDLPSLPTALMYAE